MKLSRLLPLALALLLSVLSARAEETGTMTIKTEDSKSIDI